MIIPSTKPYYSQQDIKKITKRIAKVLNSGRLILGPNLAELELNFKKYIGTKYAVAVSSCTAALEIVLRFIDVKDKEVIVPTNTFVASANAVNFAGGKPVLCEIEAQTLCANLEDIKSRVNSRTKAIIIVHIAGLPFPQINELRYLCDKKRLFLIEDAAHAVGGEIGNKKVGSFGLAGCFSFYPTKIMTTCIGGMVTTDSKKLANFAISLRHHGVGSDLTNIINLGNDWLLDEVRSILGIYQFRSLDKFIARRNEIASAYIRELKDIDSVSLFNLPKHIKHAYYKFPILLESLRRRNMLNKKLYDKYGISTGSIYYPPCHLQSLYQSKFGYKKGDFPIAEDILSRVLCLPMFARMTNREIDYVIQSFKKELAV